MKACRWSVVGASVPGARALRAGKPSQDSFSHGRLRVGSQTVLVLAVADGAGSATRAGEGAAMAAGLGHALLAAELERIGVPGTAESWQALLSSTLLAVLARFHAAASALAGPERTRLFASTLLLVAHAPPWLCSVAVGDGLLAVGRQDGSLHVLPALTPRRRWANETTFLTSADAHERARLLCVRDRDISAVALATDGAAMFALSPDRLSPATGFLEPLFTHAAQAQGSAELAAHLLGDPAISERTGDDRTLLIAVAHR